MNPLIFSAMDSRVLLLFFKKDGSGIKLPTKVGMSLNNAKSYFYMYDF